MPLIHFNIIRKTRRIDKDNLIIYRDQLRHEGRDLIKFLPSECVDCKSNDKYRIWIEEEKGLGSQGNDTIYWVRCTKCSDSFTIPYKDYKSILPILKLNIQLDNGTIDPSYHEMKVIKHKNKLIKYR